MPNGEPLEQGDGTEVDRHDRIVVPFFFRVEFLDSADRTAAVVEHAAAEQQFDMTFARVVLGHRCEPGTRLMTLAASQSSHFHAPVRFASTLTRTSIPVSTTCSNRIRTASVLSNPHARSRR